MTSNTSIWRSRATALALAFLLSACGGAATNAPTAAVTQAPTATVAPTSTPAPTATTKPAPTKAPPSEPAADAPSTSGGDADSLSSRMARLKDAKSYSVKMRMVIKGDLMELPVALEDGLPLFELEATYNNGDSRSLIKGLLAGLMGNEAGFETITVDGKSYVKGPLPLLGAKEAKWYVLPEDRQGDAKPPMDPRDLINDLAKDKDTDAALKKTGTEEIDGQTCDVYLATKEDMLAMKTNEGMTRDFSRVDKAEAKALICPDGYLHSMRLEFVGASKKSPDKESSALMDIRLFDFDKDVTIEAPADAAALEMPDFMGMAAEAGTATPESEDGATSEAAPETAATSETSSDEPVVVPADSNDGAFDTDYPLVGKVTQFMKLSGANESINYQTDASLKEVYAFYVAELTKDGLKERTITTINNDTVVNLVMDGAAGGKSIVIQAIELSPGVINVNVRMEKV